MNEYHLLERMVRQFIAEGLDDDAIVNELDRQGRGPRSLDESLKAREWIAALRPAPQVPPDIANAYWRCKEKRPKQIAVARQMGFETEQPLRDRLREVGILDWRVVHQLMAGGS